MGQVVEELTDNLVNSGEQFGNSFWSIDPIIGTQINNDSWVEFKQ